MFLSVLDIGRSFNHPFSLRLDSFVCLYSVFTVNFEFCQFSSVILVGIYYLSAVFKVYYLNTLGSFDFEDGSSLVDGGFEPRPGQNKEFKFVICYLSTKQPA